MNRTHEMRKFAVKLAAIDPKLAYELNELVDGLEAPSEQPKVASAQPAVDGRFTKLRSAVIRTAASDADAKKVLMPVLQVIKDLG